ncbi:MAG: Flp pilus assembly protein CpaB [Chloroflexota bacterium]|nr:Flp pilus assembly protein CpaB [Chloroflexota bacterium]
MTFQRKRKRSRLIIATGVLMALVVGAAIFLMLQAGAYAPAEEGVAMTDVVVAARDIAGHKMVEDGDVEMRAVPADASNENAMRDITEVLGRISAIAILPGQVIMPNMLTSADPNQPYQLPGPGEGYDEDGPPLRAYSISVPDERAVGGTIQPGQRVDILATVPVQPPAEATAEGEIAPAEFVTGPSTKVTLQNIVVLAKTGQVYILHVDLDMSEKLAELAAAGGTFTLVLRPDADARQAETDGSTLDQLLAEFDFPIPEPPDVSGSSPARTTP